MVLRNDLICRVDATVGCRRGKITKAELEWAIEVGGGMGYKRFGGHLKDSNVYDSTSGSGSA